jgi:hypothetical protein
MISLLTTKMKFLERAQVKTSRYLVIVSLIAVFYWIVGKVTVEYLMLGSTKALFWPNVGVAQGIILLCGYQYWPAITLGGVFFP